MEEITISVLGMSCSHCSQAVTDAIAELPGVAEVNVDLEKKSARVCFDPSKCAVEAIKTAIEEAGYDIG